SEDESFFFAGIEQAEGFLKSRIAELEEDVRETSQQSPSPSMSTNQLNRNKVFVVHGHDHGTKETLARYLTKIGLEPIILHEQADKGRTLIEKFEHHADVTCAVVIRTPD